MTIEFKVVPNNCECHPETCCCNPWKIVDQTGKIYATAFWQYEAQTMLDQLTKAVKVNHHDN